MDPTAQPTAAALAPMPSAKSSSKKYYTPQQRKYAEYGLAVLVLLILVIIVVVVLGHRCSNDFDCKFGQSCRSGWCKS